MITNADAAAMRAVPDDQRDDFERSMLAENNNANAKISRLDKLIAETERALFDLRAERISQVAIANFTMQMAVEHNRARTAPQKASA